MRRKDILLFVITWVDLEDVSFSETSQIKTNTTWYQIYVESFFFFFKVKLIKTEEKWLPGVEGVE